MSAFKKSLRRHLLIPKIIGSFILNDDGHLQYLQVIRILACIVSFIYSLRHEFFVPKTTFHDFVRIVHISLFSCTVTVILRVTWNAKLFKNYLETMKIVSKFANVTEFSIALWPSVLSNVIFIVVTSYKAYDVPISLLTFLSEFQLLLIANSFTDEFSIVISLIGVLSEALNKKLVRTRSREELDCILKAHSLLLSAVRQINDLYSLQILCTFALSFFNSTMFVNLFIKKDTLPPPTKAVILLWAITFFQLSLKIILSASSLTQRVGLFAILTLNN